MLEAIRYIHLNPIKSGVVHSLEGLMNYPWTGHEEIMSSETARWMDFETLERLFSNGGRGNWKMQYKKFVEIGYAVIPAGGLESENEDRNYFEAPDSSIIGFMDDKGPTEVFHGLLERVSAQTGVPSEKIISGGKRYCEINARRELLHLCKKELKLPVARIARWLGISESCASYLLKSKKSEKVSF